MTILLLYFQQINIHSDFEGWHTGLMVYLMFIFTIIETEQVGVDIVDKGESGFIF